MITLPEMHNSLTHSGTIKGIMGILQSNVLGGLFAELPGYLFFAEMVGEDHEREEIAGVVAVGRGSGSLQSSS